MPDSSPAVSAKTTKSELVPNRGWVRICLLFAILYNVAGHPEADTSALSTFNDKNQVAAYAVNGFAWAVSNKVVGGTSNTTLSPSGTATRAQDCLCCECVHPDRKSTRLNSSHMPKSRMPSSA